MDKKRGDHSLLEGERKLKVERSRSGGLTEGFKKTLLKKYGGEGRHIINQGLFYIRGGGDVSDSQCSNRKQMVHSKQIIQ